MQVGRVLLPLTVAALLGCGASPTRLLIDIDGDPSWHLRALTLSVSLEGVASTHPVPADGSPPHVPGSVIVLLPDVDGDVALAVSATLDDGSTRQATAQAHAYPHEQVELRVALEGGGAPDGGADLDVRSRYQRALSITNAQKSALDAGFTVRVPLDALDVQAAIAAGKLRSDLADLRVVWSGDGQERDRVIDLQPPGQAPALFFSLAQPIAAGATAGDYRLVYGDPDASAAPSNGKHVFALYDDFGGSTLASTWLRSGAPAVTGGHLVLHAGGTEGIASAWDQDGVPAVSAVEMSVQVPSPTATPSLVNGQSFLYWWGYQQMSSFDPIDPWILWVARTPLTVQAEQETGSPACRMGACAGGPTQLSTSFRRYRIERGPQATRFYADGKLAYTATDANSGDYSILFRNYAQTTDVVVDWVRARVLGTPDPTVSVGGEQGN